MDVSVYTTTGVSSSIDVRRVKPVDVRNPTSEY